MYKGGLSSSVFKGTDVWGKLMVPRSFLLTRGLSILVNGYYLHAQFRLNEDGSFAFGDYSWFGVFKFRFLIPK